MQTFDYIFNVGGNFTAAMDGMAESTATSPWVKSEKKFTFRFGYYRNKSFQ